ncbi:MAG: coenzyme F420-0:L-glutamate ligase [Eubacteriales bacterium]|nr:coenzyme F420-0:L-glutamate ligase [Eubacteriales bacterium]
MKRLVGTTVRGLRAPIFDEGDQLLDVLPELLEKAAKAENFSPRDRDVLCITESVLARCQGNYATIDDIAKDLANYFAADDKIGLIHPILSRNRFSVMLRGIARAVDELVIQLSYPSDEVGNQLIDKQELLDSKVNPYTDAFNEAEFNQHFTKFKHLFTGINYVDLYREICEAENCKVTFLFANDPRAILKETKKVITCDIHTRENSKKLLREAGVEKLIGLDNILATPSTEHGFNEEYGLLGSNKATDERIKLFPREAQEFVDALAERLEAKFGKKIEVMVYGDGAFKDPFGKIWELADPVVSPAFTAGLQGRPNELKIKYLADNDYAELSEEAKAEQIQARIREKHSADATTLEEAREGTTPRQITDLLGSLADLSSGSGDKGTPFVYIQGYFDSYADEYQD